MKQIIIGLDPGTLKTGFAVLLLQKNHTTLQDMGTLKASASDPLPQRLCAIGKQLETLYRMHTPQETAIEHIFLGKNIDSAFKLGQVVGLCTYQASVFQSQVYLYATRFVKKSVTGSGRADKHTVQAFVSNKFQMDLQKMTTDATDALAVALCHTVERAKPKFLTNSLENVKYQPVKYQGA